MPAPSWRRPTCPSRPIWRRASATRRRQPRRPFGLPPGWGWSAVSKPVNFMVGIKGKSFTVAELAAAGAKRISLATSLYRAAMSGLLGAAREVKDRGTFGYLDHSVSTPELNGFMQA